MLAIYTALSRPNPIGGAFSLSGLIAAQKQLGAQIKSYPKVYMFHGIKDTKVQYKMLDASIDWLKKNKINAHAITYSNLEHRIIKDEIQYISQIINSLEN